LAEAKSLQVSFPTARDLLGAYWGLLANGGLVLPSPPYGLGQGDPIALDVTIESSAIRCQLTGHVVRHPGTTEGAPTDRIVIAFDPGEPQDVLLDAAWAEIDNVPARRERRFPLDVDIRFAPGASPDEAAAAAELSGRLVNLSLGGCCLRVPRGGEASRVKVGEPLTLISRNRKLAGVVKWVDGSCRGIEFLGTERETVESFVRQFI
jgi:hypothetical protein